MSTGRDLITASMKLIGVLGSGETPSADEATDALATLNRMLSSWSTESLIIYAPVRETFALTGSDGQYTIGASADFSTARPIQIEKAFLVDLNASPNIERPIEILSLDQWQEIRLKSLDGYPAYLYIDGAFPSATIYLYPRPQNSNFLLGIWSQKQLSGLTLNGTVALPPGYEEAIVYNLAIRLAPEYGKMVPDAVAATAQDSKANIKIANSRPRYLTCDEGVTGTMRGSFNIFTGGFGR